ncbi:MAG: hypothetical protein HRT68_13895 [Flavobacteriaceae bacterium]|nr:hypothetical protein [Flavobacteriaceae bacterium]
MKRFTLFLFLSLVTLTNVQAQKKKKTGEQNFKTEMVKHYTKFYKEMIQKRDLTSAIIGLNHLLVLEPENTARKDTLGLLYYTVDNPPLAIATLANSESELGLRTKALAFKKVNNIKESINNYEVLLKKYYSVMDAYELAQLQYSVQNFGDTKITINQALKVAKDEKVQIIVAKNSYIETPITAAFLNILGLMEYNNNVANADNAIAILDQALQIDPEFVLAIENKKAILAKKNGETPGPKQ